MLMCLRYFYLLLFPYNLLIPCAYVYIFGDVGQTILGSGIKFFVIVPRPLASKFDRVNCVEQSRNGSIFYNNFSCSILRYCDDVIFDVRTRCNYDLEINIAYNSIIYLRLSYCSLTFSSRYLQSTQIRRQVTSVVLRT